MDGANEHLDEVRTSVRRLAQRFGLQYWADCDRERLFPEAAFEAAAQAGLFGALIPAEYGGSGAGAAAASVIVEEINRSGGDAAVINAQMSICGAILRAGSEAQKQSYLPDIAAGKLRCLSVAATEPDGGADMGRLSSRARRDGDDWIIDADKVFISMAEYTDLLILLTTSDDGPCLFLLDLRELGDALEIRPIGTLMNRLTTTVHVQDLRVPAQALLGAPGAGLKCLGGGFAVRRILAAAECIGNARFLLQQALEHAKSRTTFGRVIGQNQGVQYPIARAHVRIESADLMRWEALRVHQAGDDAGPRSAQARLLGGEAASEAVQAALVAFGGWALATELPIERKLRENAVFGFDNLLTTYVAERELGLPKAF